MSGGHFHNAYSLQCIAEELEVAIAEYKGDIDAIDEKLKQCHRELLKVRAMVHCIDYLLSGDYGEESFLEAWAEDVGEDK